MRKLAIALALSSTVIASPALARDGAWYVGGEFGAMLVEDIDIDLGATDDAYTLDSDYGYDGAIFAGYDLGMFRIEVEGSYKKAEFDGVSSTVALPGVTAGGRYNAAGDVNSMSAMLNGMVDFGDDEGTSGFIGGGIAGMQRRDDVHGLGKVL